MRVVALLVLMVKCSGEGLLRARLVQGDKLEKRRSSTPRVLARLEFCVGCADPHEEGSFAEGLSALQGLKNYEVNSTLAYAVPNDARRKLMNANELRDKIVVCDRGGDVPLVKKIVEAQEAGALAVVIVDDGHCSTSLDCGRAGSLRVGGFSPKDDPETWRKVTIPAILVSQDSGHRIRRLMQLEHKYLPTLGNQYLNKQQTRHNNNRGGASSSARRNSEL